MCVILPLHFCTFKSSIKQPTRNIIKITHTVFLMKPRRRRNRLLLLECKRSSDAETLRWFTLWFSHVNTAKTKITSRENAERKCFFPQKLPFYFHLKKERKISKFQKKTGFCATFRSDGRKCGLTKCAHRRRLWWPSVPCRSPEDTCPGHSSLLGCPKKPHSPASAWTTGNRSGAGCEIPPKSNFNILLSSRASSYL